jgi:hypothetical protein
VRSHAFYIRALRFDRRNHIPGGHEMLTIIRFGIPSVIAGVLSACAYNVTPTTAPDQALIAPMAPSPSPAMMAASAPMLGAAATLVTVPAAAAIAIPRPAPTASVAAESVKPAAGTESRYMVSAELYAKANGCTTPVAAMILKAPLNETFSVGCQRGNTILVRCENNVCLGV